MARLAVLALVVVLASCARSGGSEGPASGIRGRVVMNPTCPVETAASPCPAKPVATTVVIESGDGDLRRIETETDGTFRIELPPGRYLVTARPPPGTMLVPVPRPVTIEAGVRRVTVVLDSRLREP